MLYAFWQRCTLLLEACADGAFMTLIVWTMSKVRRNWDVPLADKLSCMKRFRDTVETLLRQFEAHGAVHGIEVKKGWSL